jgi:hypothetical protein
MHPSPMWKSFFLALGIFSCAIGVELLVIDSAVVLPVNGRGSPSSFTAPDWLPWSLISAGAILVLHYVSLPRKLTL